MKFKVFIFIIQVLFTISGITNTCYGQNMDSLKLALQNAKNDTTKCNILNTLIDNEDNEDVWPIYNTQLKNICESKLKTTQKTSPDYKVYKKYYAAALNNVGFLYEDKGMVSKALEFYKLSMQLEEELENKPGIASSLNNIGTLYKNQGRVAEAVIYYQKSLKIREQLNDKKGIAVCYNNIAVNYKNQGDIQKALEYHHKGMKIREQLNDKKGVAESLNNIGVIYQSQGNYLKALQCFEQSLKLREEVGYKHGIANSFNNIGNIYFAHGDVTLNTTTQESLKAGAIKAMEYYQKSLAIFNEIGNLRGVAYVSGDIGEIYMKQKNYSKALEYFKQSIDMSKKIGYPENIRNAAQKLATFYKITGNYKDALVSYELYIQMRDSMQTEANVNATIKQQMQYEFDKKQTADSLKVVEERKISEVKFKQEKQQRYFLYGGLILVALFGAFMFNRFKIAQKQKTLIEAKEKETQEQNLVITEQKYLIEERHKEITDSINYAERIQRSLLANKNLLNQYLPQYFVFFKPKDIVSGDFYWASELSNKNFALITADSTGHGVPGAIMSILNIACLNEAVKEGYTKPSEILDRTRKEVISVLKRDGSAEGGKDGMDCSLLAFDFENMKLLVSCANNPVWIVRSTPEPADVPPVIEVKPDKMPVGKHDKQNEPFTLHEFVLQKGDIIYTLTDGFPDQFGGEKGKKFMIKKLRELLVSHSHLPMPEQQALLEKTFSLWKGNNEQVDDVTIIGIKI